MRLLLTVFIYPVALLAITTIGFSYLRSFVSLADSRTKVRTAVENHSMLAFLHSGTVSSRESITGFCLLSTMSDRSRNNTLATSAFNLFAPPTPQSGDSKIVFATNRDGSMQIYVMNGDGSAITRLTSSGANDDYPRWSPNGTKILFQSDRDHPDTGYMDIYVMNLDGSGVTRLTNDPNDDGMASWSPDGSKIVFQSMRNGVNYQVYSMNADGSNQVNLSNNSSSEGEPSWSPDGTKIVFASDRDDAGYDSVYVMNSDGSNQHAITFSSGTLEDTQPVWSPDGSRIAFVSTRDSTTETWQERDDDGNVMTKSRLHLNKEVYVMNADGSGQIRLTNDPANDDSPSWSPGGLAMLFRSDRERDCCDPTAQIWTMNVDGTNQTNLSNSGNGDYGANLRADLSSYDSQLAPTNGGGNQQPVANAGGPYMGQTGQGVQLNGGASFDPDGTIVGYSWNFGDGSSGSGANVTHQYGAAGVYPVSLSIVDNNGNTASSQAFVSVDSVSLPVKIDFERLPNDTPIPNGTVITNQYLNAYGVAFASGNFAFPVHIYQNCGFCFTTSPPNFINTKPDDAGQLIVSFQQPVSNLSFYIIGIDVFFDPFAVVDVYRNNALFGSFPVSGNGTTTKQISLGSWDNINKIVIRSITDPFGIGFDDFTFNVPADVKITSGRVNGSLNGTTQKALLGADVALNASPLPGTFAGGTYAWSCTPAQTCAIVGVNNSSSVTLRTNELSNLVGNYTATVSYTKNGLISSSSVTIRSILPTLTSFAATGQVPGSVWAPFTCLDPEKPTSLWWYSKGCRAPGSTVGINFLAKVDVDSFISDPKKSGVKYVQAYSQYHKLMSRGIRCETDRSSETNVASGWRADREKPNEDIYAHDSFNDFSGLLTMIGIDENDSPERALTHFNDDEFVDALYIDDRAEMYLVYYSGVDPYNPPIERPLGKYAWNWGGLVVFDWNGNDAVHHLRATNPVLSSPSSTFPLTVPVRKDEVPCSDGSPFTNNPIDSSRVFIKYHYIDFLNRDPTPRPNATPPYEGDLRGWNFWTSNISQCVFDLNCVHARRISTGLAFFLSSEFITDDPIMANGPGSPNFDREAYNREFVYWCYVGYLHKFPDPDGWDFWTNDLNSDDDYSHMIDAFQLCDDYRIHRAFP
ncbi:MAG TPA: PKD domain-containing protein [Pyrinomonadaceae bacterium]